MKLFGTSGIRRIADTGLLLLSMKAGVAAGSIYGNLVIACDSRTSSDALKHAFISGALISGAKCTDIGLCPTPTLAIAAEKFRTGVMITASHNPPQYNGLKFINSDGSAFDGDQQSQLEEMILSEELAAGSWESFKNSIKTDDAVRNHIERIRTIIPDKLNLKVALDCGGGAASVITPILLREMGCDVIEMNCIPDGKFPRPSEPTEKNLQGLVQLTAESGADLGIAHDGDADRMMAVDDQGRFIPGDKLLLIFSNYSGGNKIVTTLDASMTIDESEFTVVRTKIGDNYVSEELKKEGDFGGEPSGSWIFPEDTLCPDGPYGAAKLAWIASQRKLSEMVDEIPQYPIMRTSMPITDFDYGRMKTYLESLNPEWMDDRDGIKVGLKDGWAMIRPSGTEPILRLAVEARDEDALQSITDACKDIIEKYSREN
ncbi:MAG: phosphoglucosamine mutase [Dehalococcoidales bacterium]|nr:phosphoglucosamine mutase [Dehalococcoidales bacterium]